MRRFIPQGVLPALYKGIAFAKGRAAYFLFERGRRLLVFSCPLDEFASIPAEIEAIVLEIKGDKAKVGIVCQ
jgi:hypothetical protein